MNNRERAVDHQDHPSQDSPRANAPIVIRISDIKKQGMAPPQQRDLHDQLQVEKALRESESRLRAVISNAPVIVMSVDLSGKIFLFDGGALDLIGIQPSQFVGQNFFEIWRDRADMICSMRECLAGLTPRPTTMLISDRILETRYSPTTEDGQVTGAITVCVDVTEQKHSEEELQGNNNLLVSVMESIAEAVFVKDLDGRYIMVNSAGARIIGKPAEEILGATDTDVFPADVARALQETDRRVLASSTPLTEEISLHIDSAQPRVLFSTKCPYRDHQGRIAGIIGVTHDVTERKKAEEALRASETRSRTLLEGSPICTKIIDLDFNLQYMSCAGQQQLKISDIEQFYGTPFPPELYPESWRAVVKEHLERAINGEVSSLDCPVLDTDGNEVWFDTTFVPARDKEGRIEYVIVTSVNITERKVAEQQARQHRDDLAHVARISTIGEMATGVAHELNQPLTAIVSYSYVARSIADESASPSADLLDALSKLEDQAIRAGDIVRRLRDFVKKDDSSHDITDLCTLVRNVAQFVKPDISQANVVLELEFEEPVLRVLVDEIQIQQVLVNLIRNAIDAMQETPLGERFITVSTRVLPTGNAEVAVRDSGTGIAPDDVELVFNAFFSTKQEGLGMGLAISRSIVEAHAGALWAEQNTGPGSTFGFVIPYQPETKLDCTSTVFIVDDEAVVRDSLFRIVKAMGFSSQCFSSADQFIEFFQRHDIAPETCLVTDMQMEQMGGIAMLRRLDELGCQIPVVFMTGHGCELIKKQAEELGIVAFLEKPFRPSHFQGVISDILKKSA